MAQKKEVKVKDLKPTKDAKGGAARSADASMNRSMNRGASNRDAANRSMNRGATNR